MTVDTFLLIIVCGMACYRLAYLVTKEHGPFDVFSKPRGMLASWANRTQARGSSAHRLAATMAELFHCPLCFGVWLALAAAALLFPDIWFLAWFSIAGVQVLAERMSSK